MTKCCRCDKPAVELTQADPGLPPMPVCADHINGRVSGYHGPLPTPPLPDFTDSVGYAVDLDDPAWDEPL